jgi:hypothetical protein
MSGFGFGGFDISNITNVSNIGETLQKIREDVENTIDASFQDDVEEGHDQGNDDAEGSYSALTMPFFLYENDFKTICCRVVWRF